MEPPVSFSADDVRDEKVKVLHAIRADAEEVPTMAVRAQYTAGRGGGKDVPGYLEEEGVPDDSGTETFAAVRLMVDNWRWAGVPFYIRTGKGLARKTTEIDQRERVGVTGRGVRCRTRQGRRAISAGRERDSGGQRTRHRDHRSRRAGGRYRERERAASHCRR